MNLLDKITGFREFCNRSMDDMEPLISKTEIIAEQIVTEMKDMTSSIKELLQKIPESSKHDAEDIKQKQSQFTELNKRLTELNSEIVKKIDQHKKNSECFTLLVFGKVNAGKSTFANTLLGWDLPGISEKDFNFRAISKEGKEVCIPCFEEYEIECTKKIQWCRVGSLKLVDTPGLDSMSMTDDHHRVADEYSNFADLILYAMNFDKQGKGDFEHIEKLCDKGKRIIPLITRSDQCDRDKENTYDEYQPLNPRYKEQEQKEEYLRKIFTSKKDRIKTCVNPDEICFVSSKLARNGILKGDTTYQVNSNFSNLIDILQKVISEEGTRLRIDNPCNTLLKDVEETEKVCNEFLVHLKKLRENFKKNETKIEMLRIELIEDCDEIFDTLKTEFNKAKSNVEKFLDEIFRLKRMAKAVFSKKKMEQDLEQKFSELVLNEDHFKDALTEAVNSVQEKMKKRIEKFISDIKNGFSNFSQMDAGLSVEVMAASLLINVFNMIGQLICIWGCGAIGGLIAEILELILIETAVTSSFSIIGTVVGGGIGLIVGGILFKLKTGEAKDVIRADISIQLEQVKERIVYGDSQHIGIKKSIDNIVEGISNHLKKELIDNPLKFIDELENCVKKLFNSLSSKRDDIETLKKQGNF
jgi:predicted GTPase